MVNRTHVIDGVEYREVERKADVGDFVLVYRSSICVVDERYGGNSELFKLKRLNGTKLHFWFDYTDFVALEPAQSIPQESIGITDILANLANRVHSLEVQLRDNQRNAERQAEEIATLRYLGASNEEDIRNLDDRTQVLNAIQKYYGGASR